MSVSHRNNYVFQIETLFLILPEYINCQNKLLFDISPIIC